MQSLRLNAAALGQIADAGCACYTRAMQTPTTHIFVSPHLDDVALSCGGLMAALAQAGERVVALTIFAATPANDELTPIARELQARWKTGTDPVAARRAEDVAACARLGVQPAHLAWTDCVYRTGDDADVGLYVSESSLFGPVHPQERSLPQALCAAIADHAGQGRTRFYAPLGAGHHVDHQLVHLACAQLLSQGHDVRCYEDYPYADQPEAVRQALAVSVMPAMRADIIAMTGAQLEAKLDAVACYRSQIGTFWRDDLGQPDLLKMRQTISAYAARVAGHGYAERYWVPSSSTRRGFCS